MSRKDLALQRLIDEIGSCSHVNRSPSSTFDVPSHGACWDFIAKAIDTAIAARKPKRHLELRAVYFTGSDEAHSEPLTCAEDEAALESRPHAYGVYERRRPGWRMYHIQDFPDFKQAQAFIEKEKGDS